MKRKLRKVQSEKWIGGVCGGFAYCFGVPAWAVRLLWLAAVFGYGVGGVLYLFFWIFMPNWDRTPEDYTEVAGG
ncbi:PspC domain-containing protein [Candidatus Kuenenbacteria bacterium]|nr:PspC domain-containing protein [Candidatus Kuenenbacteria bacterium]